MVVHIMVFRQQPTNYLYFTTIAGLFEVRLSLFIVLGTKKKLCYDKGNAIARQLRHRPEKTGGKPIMLLYRVFFRKRQPDFEKFGYWCKI